MREQRKNKYNRKLAYAVHAMSSEKADFSVADEKNIQKRQLRKKLSI